MTYDDVTPALAAAAFFTVIAVKNVDADMFCGGVAECSADGQQLLAGEGRSGWYIAIGHRARMVLRQSGRMFRRWPTAPLGKQRGDWYIATWAPHLYHFAHEASVPDACIALLRRHSERAQWDFYGGLRQSLLCLRLTQMIYWANSDKASNRRTARARSPVAKHRGWRGRRRACPARARLGGRAAELR